MEDLGFNIFDKINKVFDEEFKFWNVDENGNIFRKDYNYEIKAERLIAMNWLNQVMHKNEKIAESEFYFVFTEALRRTGYKKLIIDLEDETKISAEK